MRDAFTLLYCLSMLSQMVVFDGLRPTTEETRNWMEIGQVIDIGEISSSKMERATRLGSSHPLQCPTKKAIPLQQ